MAIAIYVFNRGPIANFTEEEILGAVTESNYPTLCAQYGLDPDLIGPTLERLRIVISDTADPRYILVQYRGDGIRAILVNRWKGEATAQVTSQALSTATSEDVRSRLAQTKEVFTIALEAGQLHDLGRLLAYELARWAAVRGDGIVLALDGRWYRLNRHKAFLPLDLDHP